MQVGSPPRLHPGRGVGEDVDAVPRQGVGRGGTRLVPRARPCCGIAGGKKARPLRARGRGGTHGTSPDIPVSQWAARGCQGDVAPDSPQHQDVGGVASGATGRPGAEEVAGAALLKAGEVGGLGGACGQGAAAVAGLRFASAPRHPTDPRWVPEGHREGDEGVAVLLLLPPARELPRSSPNRALQHPAAPLCVAGGGCEPTWRARSQFNQ